MMQYYKHMRRRHIPKTGEAYTRIWYMEQR